jgi:hypothetical protein
MIKYVSVIERIEQLLIKLEKQENLKEVECRSIDSIAATHIRA